MWIIKLITKFLSIFPKLFAWLSPLLRWIPSKLGLVANLLFAYAKTILTIFFLITIFTPVLTAVSNPDTSLSQKSFDIIDGIGETVATPDMAIADNIAILRESQTNPDISTMEPYSILFRSAIELLAIFVVGFIFVAFINTNMSTKYGVGTFVVVIMLYSTTVMSHTGELPFYGLLWSENSLIKNLDIFFNPLAPLYELYSSLRLKFSSLDLVL